MSAVFISGWVLQRIAALVLVVGVSPHPVPLPRGEGGTFTAFWCSNGGLLLNTVRTAKEMFNGSSFSPGEKVRMRGNTAVWFAAADLSTPTSNPNSNPSSLSDEELLQIKFDQKLGGQVSLDLPFRDEGGKSVQVGDYFNHKPVILNLGYYECPMLCSLVLNGAVEALQDLKARPGEDFEFVCVSIHPAETAGQAAAKKRTFVKRYGRNDTGDGWHFLTGDEAAIERLADEVGFRYAYDAQLREYAHPSGLIVLTPEGKVSRYLFGVSFAASEIDKALKDARGKRIGSPIEQLMLLCFHYNPLTGKYGELIMTVVRASGVVTLAGVGWIIIAMRRRQRGRFTREVAQ